MDDVGNVGDVGEVGARSAGDVCDSDAGNVGDVVVLVLHGCSRGCGRGCCGRRGCRGRLGPLPGAACAAEAASFFRCLGCLPAQTDQDLALE